MSDEIEYDEDAVMAVANACRDFLEAVDKLPPAAVALMFPALRARLEENMSISTIRMRESQLGRSLTSEECEQEGVFFSEELIRAEAYAESHKDDLMFYLRVDTLNPPEPRPGALTQEQREELFREMVEDRQALSNAIRASQGFWSEMVAAGVGVDVRMLLICHVKGMCGRQMALQGIESARRRLGRLLTDEDMVEALDAVTDRKRAIDSLSHTKREELEQLVCELGAQAEEKGEPPSPTPQELRYIT